MTFERVWAMPNRYTFTIKPVAELLQREVGDSIGWIDPFAGNNSPAHFQNDIDPESPALWHEDALSWLKRYNDKVPGCLFDPPYSAAMMFGKYASQSAYTQYILKCKDEIARLLSAGGKAICFGWNSNGLGMKRGFQLVSGMIIAHGGSHQHDTIVTVEVKQ